MDLADSLTYLLIFCLGRESVPVCHLADKCTVIEIYLSTYSDGNSAGD